MEASGGLAAAAGATAALVTKAGFPAKAVPEFGSAQRSKLALNMNNAVCALMGLSVAGTHGPGLERWSRPISNRSRAAHTCAWALAGLGLGE